MPISSLKADFTNFPAGTKVTVGSILFGMLELPEEVVEKTEAAPGGSGEQLQTQAAAGPAPAAANGVGGTSTSKAKSKPKPKQAAGGQEAEGDPFSRIEMKVGRITKVGRLSGPSVSSESFGNVGWCF